MTQGFIVRAMHASAVRLLTRDIDDRTLFDPRREHGEEMLFRKLGQGVGTEVQAVWRLLIESPVRQVEDLVVGQVNLESGVRDTSGKCVVIDDFKAIESEIQSLQRWQVGEGVGADERDFVVGEIN